MAIAIIGHLQLEKAVGEPLAPRYEAIGAAGRLMPDQHFLPTNASTQCGGGQRNHYKRPSTGHLSLLPLLIIELVIRLLGHQLAVLPAERHIGVMVVAAITIAVAAVP